MTNAIEEALEDINAMLDELEGLAREAFGGQCTTVATELTDKIRAALSAPTPSGLTEEEGWQDIATLPLLEGAQIVKGGTVPYSAADGLVTECFDGVTTIAPLKKGDRIWPHMQKWRPTSASSIDWKRIANIRAAHENAIACWDSEHGMTPGHGERAHADRAFLLSLLPDALKGEVKP